jgi:hypothetical protein
MTYGFDQKPEWNTVRLVWLALEMKSIYEMCRICVDLFLRNALRDQIDVLANSYDAMISW